MKFAELKDWIENNINLSQKKNYQIVMFRALLENIEHRLTKKEIQKELQKYNPERSVDFFSKSPVFDALVGNKIVEFINSDNSYQLILEQPLSEKERDDLIKQCNVIIEKGIDVILEERNQHKYILTELEEFYGKIDTVQLQVLRRFKRKAGKNLTSAKIRASGKNGDRLESASVNAPFLMHHLNSGVYYHHGYAQAIYLNPASRWKLEIDREHPTLKIKQVNATGRQTDTILFNNLCI